VLADIGGPAIEPALLHANQIVGRKVVAEPVALLHQCPQLAGLGVKGHGRRVARARRDRHLLRAVGVEALDRRLRLGLDSEIARRADADIERAEIETHPAALVTTRRRPSTWRAASIWSRRDA
jgi:hypothetical protein